MKTPLILLALLSLLGAQAQSYRSMDEIKSSGQILIGSEGEFPPFNFFDPQGNLSGFEIDVANALAEKLGLEPKWIPQSFDTLLIALNQGRFDFVIASHGITPERAHAVDFTDPHYCTGGMVVALPGGPKSAADLAGKRVGVQVGSTYFEAAGNITNIKEVKTYQSDPEALQDLLAHRIDAWITDRFVADNAAKERQLDLQMGELLFQEQVAMAVAKGNSELVSALNQGLAEIMTDGTYAEISQKWFGSNVSCQ